MEEKIIQYLRTGPKFAIQLTNKLGHSKATIYRHLMGLARSGKIYMLPVLKNGKWHSLFCLPQHLDQAIKLSGYIPADYRDLRGMELESRIKSSIQRLRSKLYREPELEEVALEIGVDPSDGDFRSRFFAIASQLGWRPPSPTEKLMGDSRRARILSIARMLRSGINPRCFHDSEIREAKRYMEMFPEDF